MKAVLVIDVDKDELGEAFATITAEEKGITFFARGVIRPLPERQKVKAGAGGYTRGFTAGFNKFRYFIAGADEEIEE